MLQMLPMILIWRSWNTTCHFIII